MSLSSWWASAREHLQSEGVPSGNLGVDTGAHLGVFSEPFLSYVLDGSKTVESRFSSNRCPPFRAVSEGDILLVKAAGGPVVALGEILRTWYLAHPTRRQIDDLAQRFGRELRDDVPDFWDSRRDASFVSLFSLGRVYKFERPLECPKRDRRGWVVLSSVSVQGSLFG